MQEEMEGYGDELMSPQTAEEHELEWCHGETSELVPAISEAQKATTKRALTGWPSPAKPSLTVHTRVLAY